MFEIFRHAAPRAVRIAIMFNPSYPFAQTWLDGYDRAASMFGMKLQYFPVTQLEEVGPALERIAAIRPDLLFVSAERIALSRAREIGKFAIDRGLIAVSNAPTLVAEGALLSYGSSLSEGDARVAYFVDRILRGAKPADLPVEMPAKYELIVNAKTARAIGYSFPPSLLARADRVIE